MIIDLTPELAEATRNVLDAHQPFSHAITARNISLGAFVLLTVALIFALFSGNRTGDLDDEVIDVAGTTVSRPGKTQARIIMALIIAVIVAFVSMFATGITRTLMQENLNSSAESLVVDVEHAVNGVDGVEWVTSDPDIDGDLFTVTDRPACLIVGITEGCSGGYPAATVAVDTDDGTENVDVIVSINHDSDTLMLQPFTLDGENENRDGDD